ncbi:MAG: ribosomal L7Ae/L30e/S12e/Gadd45 family protein [Bacillales bacterium]|jgi:ribosomal protein L7Ae-like RNA K-turn-binding protein|nr:ribosomal L7Ae/L30e/S12e/Gadd45 family protein [Bacillales bacterium]
MDKILSFLGLLAKAGEIVYGEVLLNSIKSKKVYLVISALDTGKSNKKKYQDKSKFYEIDFYEYSTKEHLSKAVGKENCSVLGLKSKNGSAKLKALFKEVNDEKQQL